MVQFYPTVFLLYYNFRNKLDKLIWDQNITNAASHHARWLAKSEIKSHIESKNVLGIKTLKDLQDRFDYYKCYAFCENIVWIPNEGYYGDNVLTPLEMVNKMAASAVESWINSKAHRANMLSKIDGKGAIGIGISIYADSTLYAIVMNIGFPSDFKKR